MNTDMDMDIDINTMTDTITCRLVEARADLGITRDRFKFCVNVKN